MSKRPEQISFFHEAFDPHEIEILDVVFENVRAAIGEPLNDPAVRELVAARLFNFAMRGERDPAKLYRRIVESYQAAPLTNYVTVAPGIVPDCPDALGRNPFRTAALASLATGEATMSYPNNSPRRNDGYGRNGMGSGTWIAIAVAIVVIVVGAIYWASGNDASTANNRATPVTTTGSAPTSPAPTTPQAPAPAKK